MQRKRLLVGLLCIVIIALIAVVLLSPKIPSHTISESYMVPGNFSAAAAYGSNSIVLPNGRSFVDYNYTTGQTKSLGPNATLTGLSNIDSLSVSPDKQYVLFHDESAASGGFLYSQLVGAGADPTLDYWWVYSIAKQTFTPLPQGVLIAKFAYNSDNVVALASANGGEALTVYSPGAANPSSPIAITGSSNFFPVSDGYILQTPGNSVLFTKDGTVSQTLYSSVTLVGITSDGSTAIGVSSAGKSRSLVVLDLTNNSEKSIAGNVIGRPALGASGVLYASGTSNTGKPPVFYTYNLSTHKIYSLTFSGNAAALQKKTLTPAALLDPTTVIASDNTNNYYVFGNNLAILSFPDQNYAPTVQTPDGSSIQLQYDTQATQLTATIDGSDPAGDETAVYQQLRDDGYNPDLIDMNFIINSGTGDE